MKNLELNAYGVVEMSHQEIVEANGGVVEFLYEYITGRSLAQDARKLTVALIDATAKVIQEGGTTVANSMGSK